MDNIWRYTFHSESCVALEEYQVLPTETVSNPNANREQMTRIMFGTFNMVYAHFLAHHPSTVCFWFFIKLSGRTPPLSEQVLSEARGRLEMLPISESTH